MVVALVDDAAALGPANERLRGIVVAQARVAAFTSPDRGADALRLASEQEVALLLVDAPDGEPDAGIAAVLDRSPCDVALVTRGPTAPARWSSRSAAATTTGRRSSSAPGSRSAHGAPLRLAGTEGHAGGRDASRLLASASLALQRGAGVLSETVLVPSRRRRRPPGGRRRGVPRARPVRQRGDRRGAARARAAGARLRAARAARAAAGWPGAERGADALHVVGGARLKPALGQR